VLQFGVVISSLNDWPWWCREELHLLKESGSVDVDKLQQIDELANSVGLRDTPVMVAQWKLQAIVKAPSPFEEWYWQILGFVISSGTGALLFFKGISGLSIWKTNLVSTRWS